MFLSFLFITPYLRTFSSLLALIYKEQCCVMFGHIREANRAANACLPLLSQKFTAEMSKKNDRNLAKC